MNQTIQQLFNLKGKKALITGGAGYLGKAMAETLLELGAEVILVGRTTDTLQKVKAELENQIQGAKVTYQTLDLMDSDAVKKAISKISNLDILINNAWSGNKNSFESISFEDWEYDINMSLNSTFKLIKMTHPLLKESKGVILNIASMYGHVAPDYRMYNKGEYVNPPSYGAAKAGIIQLTKYLGSFLAPDGIRVNVLSPGTFPHLETQQDPEFMKRLAEKNPMNRIGVPEDLKGAVALLCSPASAYMTGQNICVDGGWTIW